MQHTIARRDAAIARLRKDNSGLHEIQDLQREHIVERDRRIAGLEKELAEARKLSDEQYQFALATQTENESLRAQLSTASESHRAIQGVSELPSVAENWFALSPALRSSHWVCIQMQHNYVHKGYEADTPLAAVNAALEAAGKETV